MSLTLVMINMARFSVAKYIYILYARLLPFEIEFIKESCGNGFCACVNSAVTQSWLIYGLIPQLSIVTFLIWHSETLDCSLYMPVWVSDTHGCLSGCVYISSHYALTLACDNSTRKVSRRLIQRGPTDCPLNLELAQSPAKVNAVWGDCSRPLSWQVCREWERFLLNPASLMAVWQHSWIRHVWLGNMQHNIWEPPVF